jgi:DNA-binding NarL/FixJ family response regulator
MVSVQPENQYASRCLLAGATAYVNKDSASEELAPAIKKILDRKQGASGARAEPAHWIR